MGIFVGIRWLYAYIVMVYQPLLELFCGGWTHLLRPCLGGQPRTLPQRRSFEQQSSEYLSQSAQSHHSSAEVDEIALVLCRSDLRSALKGNLVLISGG